MPKKIVRSACIKPGCSEESLFKRLCKTHYAEAHPDEPVYEYRFEWSIVERLAGTVRATDYKEALALVEKGVIHGDRVRADSKPSSIKVLGEVEC